MKILLIIPAYNEADNIGKLIDNINTNYKLYDYIIINDGSTDSTAEICKKRGYHYINLTINLGIGGAVQTGYQYALENEYDIAVQLDGDGQHNVEYVNTLIKPIINGEADMVIGSRFIDKKGFQSSAIRRLGIQFLSRLIQVSSGKRIKDVTSGFRAINREYIKIFAADYPTDYPEPEAIVSVFMHKGTVKEVAVRMNERESGISSINIWKSCYYMIKVTLAVIVCRISFGIRR
nr:glycosyltransferase family 2 protein [uncultured Eisenbergiella sp.]